MTIEAAATVVIAWRRGLRPVADLVLGQPYVFVEVEGLLGMSVPPRPRSKLRDRALREETTAAIDIVVAGSIARRVITGEGSPGPEVLHRAASRAKRVASGRGIQKLVTDAIDRVEGEMQQAAVRATAETLTADVTAARRLSPELVEPMLGDRTRLGWQWWRSLLVFFGVACSGIGRPRLANRRADVVMMSGRLSTSLVPHKIRSGSTALRCIPMRLLGA